ncbi:MAG: UvrD-helicase domain-containing protein, partial [Atribacterota bacterium]|nr:UvrD-helicase domain-containing protein [Atribacterota bacterium]
MNREQKMILHDQEARNQIFNDFNHNFLVEASAGSGKTSCLVKRMAALVKAGRYSVEQIAAITFTRKAAFELKERFQQEIERELQKINSPAQKSLLFKALINIEQCYIGTIHSFCARILRERPIEAGLDPTFKELDEIDNILFMEQAWEQYLSNLKVQDSALFQNLAMLGIPILNLKESYKQVCQYPEVQILHEKVDNPQLDSTMNELFSFCEEAIQYIPEQGSERGYDSIQQAILQVQKFKRYHPYSQKDFYKISLLEPFSKNFHGAGSIILNRWLSKEKAKEYRDIILPELKEKYIEPAIERWREYCHDHIFRFIKPAVEYYHQFREKHSMLNFQDLLLRAAFLLRNNPETRLYFQQKYRTILVDEFQDTDPIQAEIIFYLTGMQLGEDDWKKLTPRAGSLF